MKTFVTLMFFVGLFCVLHGIYEQKLQAELKNQPVQVRFIPRSFLDEQHGGAATNMRSGQWFDSVGAGLDAPSTLVVPVKSKE